MRVKTEMSARRYGKLVVLRYSHSRKGLAMWWVKCDCGKEKVVSGWDLRSGHSTSCGCYKRERMLRHGHTTHTTRTKTYGIWEAMRHRCSNENSRAFKHYGGRGIKVCERWQLFENFLADMGERPVGMEIDRIDNNKGYCPENCRWVSRQKNMSNTRRNKFIEFNGERKTISEWSRIYNIHRTILGNRIRRGWDIETAFNTPAETRK